MTTMMVEMKMEKRDILGHHNEGVVAAVVGDCSNMKVVTTAGNPVF